MLNRQFSKNGRYQSEYCSILRVTSGMVNWEKIDPGPGLTLVVTKSEWSDVMPAIRFGYFRSSTCLLWQSHMRAGAVHVVCDGASWRTSCQLGAGNLLCKWTRSQNIPSLLLAEYCQLLVGVNACGVESKLLRLPRLSLSHSASSTKRTCHWSEHGPRFKWLYVVVHPPFLGCTSHYVPIVYSLIEWGYIYNIR